MHRSRSALLAGRLADERGRRVAFVSHCLLNRTPATSVGRSRPARCRGRHRTARGGRGDLADALPRTTRLGRRAEAAAAARARDQGEPAVSAAAAAAAPLRRIHPLRIRAAGAGVAREIADYQRSGYEVVGIIGVGSSPSCGVHHTLDMRGSLEVIAACPIASIDRATMNERAVAGCRTPGEGIFTQQLRRRLDRDGITVPFVEYDIVAEMGGEAQDPVAELLRAAAGGTSARA